MIPLLLLLFLPFMVSKEYCVEWKTIAEGDSCWKIATDKKLTVEALQLLNPGVDCNKLEVGNKLCLSTSITQPKCTKRYKIIEGDTCFHIWTSHKLAQREFLEMNEGIDCDKLELFREICVGVGNGATETSTVETSDVKPALSMVETPTPPCYEFHTVKEGDTCYQVSVAYGLKLDTLQNTYDCDALQIGDTICVSQNFTCQHRFEIHSGDTCWFMEQAFKTNQTEMERANEGVSCDNLPVGRKMCVWSADDRKLPNMTCTVRKTMGNGDKSCNDVARENSLTIDHFKFLNPRVNCSSKIPKDSDVCVKDASTKPCSSIQPVLSDQNCSIIMQLHQISNWRLMNLNPTLRCDRLDNTFEICVGNGPFKQTECVDTQRVSHEIDTCEKLSKVTGLSVGQIEELNPGTKCGKSFEWGSLVCTANLGFDTKTAQGLMILNLKDLAPELLRKFNEYNANPSEETENAMNQQLVIDLQRPNVNSRLKELYKIDDKVRKILDSQHPLPRKDYCDEIQKTKMAENIKKCFCESEELLLYCQVVAMKAFLDAQSQVTLSRNVSTVPAMRKKRGIGCSLSIPTKGNNTFSVFKNIYGGCFGGGCSYPIGFVEISVDANICLPIVKLAQDTILYCAKKDHDCRDVEVENVPGLKWLAGRSIGGSISICAIGSSIVEFLTKGGLSLCWELLAAEYFGFVGKLDLGSKLKLIVVSLEGGVIMKTHGMAFPKMCEYSEFECEDYCRWKAAGWDNGKVYGYFEIRPPKLFAWTGFKFFKETYDEPKRIGCNTGQEAAVVIRNERNCKNAEDNEIQRRCWSADDKMGWASLDPEWGFTFKPHIFGRTLFICEFTDRHGQKIGFDVYGGTSNNKGKKTFHYVVKNDGIYFGMTKYKEDYRKGAWENQCEEYKEPPIEPEKPKIEEPTGSSQVPAASCGKRIVGYYTGWGEREITENQLKKLTHVIFAFVAMYADGSVRFGAVSEDDSGPQAAVKAERRFLDMKRKARAVNSGVRVLFAVGGWDNSQYFSPMAADPVKRKTFIDSVASFIEKHQIDGVDLDWEYPDMNGKDKVNHVTLIRELRERFNEMQKSNGRKDPYVITLASAAGEWNLRNGYDLSGILKYADFINVMTYDYYGAWESKWGAYTGTPAPLYYGSLKGFSGKLNADFSMRFYTCKTKKPSQLNMGVPFYGRYWKNVLGPIDSSDDMWRTAAPSGGVYEGGYVGWRNLEKEGWNKGATSWHEKTKTPYILNSAARMFLGFENERSLKDKISYATDRNLGGLMIWALDLDDDADTLLNLVSSAGLCSGGSGDKVTYTCVPIDDVRWWTPENSDETKQGQCGKSAPLINGFYPVCDPDDPGYSCCGAAGYCGSGKEYCDCKGCVNYGKDPKLIVKEPTKPSIPIQWYTQDAPDGKRGRCGKDIPKINGKTPICNPDDETKHCCSNGGYCGTGKEYCSCDGCVDHKKG